MTSGPSNPRASERRRLHLAALSGVCAASGLIGVSLVGLNRDVLPFHAWPTVESPTRGRTLVPDVAIAARPPSASAQAAIGRRGTVRLPDGRTVTLPLPGAIAAAGVTATGAVPQAAAPAGPAPPAGRTPSTTVPQTPAFTTPGTGSTPVAGPVTTAPAVPSVPSVPAAAPAPAVAQTPVVPAAAITLAPAPHSSVTARDGSRLAASNADEPTETAPPVINLAPSASPVADAGDGLPSGVVVGVSLDPAAPVDTTPAVADEAIDGTPPVDVPPVDPAPVDPPAAATPAPAPDPTPAAQPKPEPAAAAAQRSVAHSAPAAAAPAPAPAPAAPRQPVHRTVVAPAPKVHVAPPAPKSAPAPAPAQAPAPAPAPVPAVASGDDQGNGHAPEAHGGGADDDQ